MVFRFEAEEAHFVLGMCARPAAAAYRPPETGRRTRGGRTLRESRQIAGSGSVVTSVKAGGNAQDAEEHPSGCNG